MPAPATAALKRLVCVTPHRHEAAVAVPHDAHFFRGNRRRTYSRIKASKDVA